MGGPTARKQGSALWWAWVLGSATVAAALVQVGYWFYLTPDNVASCWPASGVAMAAHLLASRSQRVAIFLGHVLGQLALEVLVVGNLPAPALALSANGATEALLAAWIWRWVAPEHVGFRHGRALAGLLLASLLAPLPTATFGAWIVLQLAPMLEFGAVWEVWRAADFIGLAIFAPPAVAWATGERSVGFQELGERHRFESVAAAAALAVVCYVGVGPGSGLLRTTVAHDYLAFPLVIWVALRFGPRATTTASAVVALAAVIAAKLGYGPFVSEGLPGGAQVLRLQGLISLLSLTGLAAATTAVARRASEAARREAEAGLLQAQKMEAVGMLAGGVAHDFNNLLTIIHGNAELGAFAVEAGERAQTLEALQQIEEATERARALTQQLLVFSQRQPIRPVRLRLRDRIDELNRMLPRVLREDIRVEVEHEESRAMVTADPVQVDQVVLNLAVNARDALPKGGTITIRTWCRGEQAGLTVSDDGEGMDASIQARVFTPFFTTKSAGRGTGLGLSTVQSILKRGGGGVSITSAPGEGTTIECRWPVSAYVDDVSPQASGARDLVGKGESILLCEDDANVRRVTARFLEQAGYCVHVAPTPEQALAMLDRVAVDLLVTDIVMPGMDGVSLAEAARREVPGLEVLYVSGYVPERPDDVAIDPELLLAKPFSREALLERVRVSLDRAAEPLRAEGA